MFFVLFFNVTLDCQLWSIWWLWWLIVCSSKLHHSRLTAHQKWMHRNPAIAICCHRSQCLPWSSISTHFINRELHLCLIQAWVMPVQGFYLIQNITNSLVCAWGEQNDWVKQRKKEPICGTKTLCHTLFDYIKCIHCFMYPPLKHVLLPNQQLNFCKTWYMMYLSTMV